LTDKSNCTMIKKNKGVHWQKVATIFAGERLFFIPNQKGGNRQNVLYQKSIRKNYTKKPERA